MAQLREIKRRIKSVHNIAQVTNAMQLVAASRMKKAQENAERGKLYAEKIRDILLRLSINKSVVSVPFVDPTYAEEANTVLVLVFSPQRGLAGPLPGNLLRHTLEVIEGFEAQGKEVHLVTIGSKLGKQLAHQVTVVADFSDMPEEPTTADIYPILSMITSLYLEKKIREAFVIYPEFVNALVQKAKTEKLLPLTLDDLDDAMDIGAFDNTSAYAFEPSEAEILQTLVPNYLETQVYQKRLETIASEYSARMVAMKNATENAKEVKDDLTIEYNKSRQAQITQELSEINAGRIK